MQKDLRSEKTVKNVTKKLKIKKISFDFSLKTKKPSGDAFY